MKSRIKTVIAIIIVIILAMVVTNIIGNHEKKELSGNLKIVVNSKNYKYINSVTDQFKEKHHKVKITVEEVSDKGYFNRIMEGYEKGDKPNIVVANNTDIRNLINENEIIPVGVGDIINTYAGNFGTARLNESKINGEYYSVPFSSNPIGLFAREDLLKEYGYSSNDINTWEDVITVGKAIYTKSKGAVKLLSGTGDNYNELVNLLIMENLNLGNNKEETIKNTKAMINKLEKDNILTMNSNEGFAGMISSINGVKSIEGIEVPCQWKVINPPALVQGANKFYEEGGEDLLILNNKNVELSKAFLSFLTNDTKLSLEYTLSANLFSSYLYTYKNTEIENEMNNFVGQSPLVVLSNIAGKAPSVQNYDEFLEISKQILNSNIKE
ncbi:MAG: ABC transporter substrate-binding protein [Clostridium sp.]